MVLTRTDENELLTALHSGLFQPLPWRLFLTRLRARTEADVCRLFIKPFGDAAWQRMDDARSHAAGANPFDPDPPAYDELRDGRVYAGDELASGTKGRARHLRVSWPEGGDLALSILRAKGDFRARDASLLASLAPHLVIALRAQMELEGVRRKADVSAGALAAFSSGWLLLDARGRVMDCDPGAARMLEAGRMARRAGDGRLRLFLSEAEALLEDVLARRDAPIEPQAVWMNHDPPVQLAITRPPEQTAQSLAAPHCLLVMRRMILGQPVDGCFLPALFRLTRSEAALASYVAGGASLAGAADALGLTIETARNYSKRIYVKTGARGQADLVRIVLDGVRAAE